MTVVRTRLSERSRSVRSLSSVQWITSRSRCHAKVSGIFVPLYYLSGLDYSHSLVRPGYQEDVSALVEVTRDIVKERLKGDPWIMWAIAQRASLPVKIEACVT